MTMTFSAVTILSVFALLLVAAVLRLKHPFYFYIPGLLGRIFKPAKSYEEVKWSSPMIFENRAVENPNIVFIIADDLGFNDLSSGSAGVKTPNIDSIAADGATFATAYAGHATCSPSRAAIYTGRYPSRIGFENTAVPKIMSWIGLSQPMSKKYTAVQPIYHAELYDQVPPMEKMIVPLEEIMIPQVLKEFDYSTGFIG